MDIKISNINENKSISLLMELIKIEQQEKEELSLNITKLNEKVSGLSKDISGFEDRCSVFEEEKTELEGRCTTLETEKAELESKCSVFEEEKTKLEGRCTTLETEKAELESKCSVFEKEKTKLEGRYTTLETEKAELESKCSVFEEEKTKLEGRCTTLETEKAELEGKYSILETEKTDLENTLQQTKTKLLSDKLNTIQLLLNFTAAELSDNNWQEFIQVITKGINSTIKSQASVENKLRDIQVKNGWLTKLASLHWWSKESHVKGFIPNNLNEGSLLHKTFDDFLEYLASNQIQISLPEMDFSGRLEKYNDDYDSDPKWIKELFPEFQSKDYLLVEICYLSINSKNGQCLAINRVTN